VGKSNYFLLQNVQLGSGDNPASHSLDNGVKHSGREVYHSSSSRAEFMNEWNCISISLYAFIAWAGYFSHLSHARYMPDPSGRCNQVDM